MGANVHFYEGRYHKVGRLSPCGCRLAECCLSCTLPVCTGDMDKGQQQALTALQRAVAGLESKPLRSPDSLRPTKALLQHKSLLSSLVASRAEIERGFARGKASSSPRETDCPRCGDRLRRDYDDMVCIPCGYRVPAEGDVFTEYPRDEDAVVAGNLAWGSAKLRKNRFERCEGLPIP